MEERMSYTNKESELHQKINLSGVICTYCGNNVVIYNSEVYDSFGKISFVNRGYCAVEIFKNNDSEPTAIIKPGDNFTLTSNPFFRIEIRCKRARDPLECVFCKMCCGRLCYEGFVYIVFDGDNYCINFMCK